MITNYSVRSWCGLGRPSRVFDIDKADKLRANRNTLMFVISNEINLKELDEECSECVFLIDKSHPSVLNDISPNGNDFIRVANPKYDFCIVVEKLGLVSRFQYYAEEEIIYGNDDLIDPGVILGGTDFSPVIGESRSELVQFPQMGGVRLGDHVIIKYNSMIGKGTFDYTEIGDYTMIDYGCQIGHNCIIGNACIIAAGTIIGGGTVVGENTTIGIGAYIRNGLHIGNNVSIGMGSVVIRDIPDNCVVVGNPARIIEHKPIFDKKGLV